MDSTPKLTLKRKRYEPQEQELRVRIEGKIHHEKKEVSRAVKQTKLFETQKAVKRLKGLRKKNEDTDAMTLLEEELCQIKLTNPDELGNVAFRTKILKDHILRSNPEVLSSMAKELSITTPQPSQGSAAKVHSRLLSSKILAKQVADSVLSLKAVLDPSLKTKGKAVKPAKTKEDGLDADENAESLSEDAIEGPRKKMKAPPAQADDQDQEDAGWESGTVNGDDEDIDEGEDGWESESIGQRPGLALEVDNSANDGSSSEDDSSPVSELAVKSIKPKLKATTTSKLPLTGGNSKLSSTFLPSLSVGFVRGGSSDSDFEDDGAEGKAGDLPKKNRRGQRARQAIWEKKFGRNANHKKKKVFKEQERSVQAAYAQRKGKIGTRPNARPQMKGAQGLGLRQVDSSASLSGWKQHQDTGPRTHEKAQPDSGWSNTASRNSKLKSADDKPLHPSWEAKKRLKEKESGSLVPSQGKKIKF